MRRYVAVIALLVAVVASTVHVSAQTTGDQGAISWQSAGDSYSSGTGIPNTTGACWHSSDAYGPAAARIVRARGWRIDSETFTACHGHLVEDFFNERQGSGDGSLWDWGRRQGGPERVDVLTMSFGGNDIGFGDVMRDCVVGPDNVVEGLIAALPLGLTFLSWLSGCDVPEDELKSRIDALLDPPRRNCTGTRVERTDSYDCDLDIGSRRGSIIDLYYDIVQDRLTENGHLYVIGYPQLFAPIHEGRWYQKGYCAGVIRTDVEELNRVARYFDQKLQDAVHRANEVLGDRVRYLSLRHLYRAGKHELCGTNEDWINGITFSKFQQSRNPLNQFRESFHPNYHGHHNTATKLAELIIQDLTNRPPTTTQPTTTQPTTTQPTTTPPPSGTGEPRITLEWVSDTYTFDEDATNPAVKLRATAGGTKKPVRDLVITVRTRPGTALPAEDFIPFTDSVTFTAADFRLDDGGWALTAEVGVELLADDKLEVPESFSLAIDAASVPEHARVDAASATAEIVITDTSGPATLGVSEPSPTVVEGSLLTLCVEHDWWVEFPFLVTFVVDTANSADLPDPATWNVDYWTLEQQTVLFDVLESKKCIEMPTAWDGLAEGSEQLTVSFSSSDARVVVPDPVTVTIVDGEPIWHRGESTINEADGDNYLYLFSCGNTFIANGVTLEFDLTVGGTATVGRDYTIAYADGRELSAPYTLNCPDQGGFEREYYAGENYDGDILVTSVDDTDVEGDETVELTASYKGTVIGTVTITIDDDDASGG